MNSANSVSSVRSCSSMERPLLFTVALVLALSPVALRADEADDTAKAAELATKLENPVADLVSVPVKNNWDFGIGPAGAMRYSANIQPVLPFRLSEDWNLITRTIVPVIYQESPLAGGDDLAGLGDIQQSFFFAPREKVGGWIVGAGSVFLYPSATDDALGSEKFGLGPTAVVLQQRNGWTYGMLANHLWSVAGESSRADVDNTFFQPFLSYRTKTFTTFGVNSESSYDWEAHAWTVPVTFGVSQMLKVGKRPIQLGLSARYYVEKPADGPDWGLGFKITFLFPK